MKTKYYNRYYNETLWKLTYIRINVYIYIYTAVEKIKRKFEFFIFF